MSQRVIYLAWLAFVLVLAFLLDLCMLDLPVLCWLLGCSHSEEVAGGWCSYCYRIGNDEYHGPVWARRVL
jgi:hypothetical protein